MNYVLKVNGWPIKIFIMKLEIFSNIKRVDYPSIEIKNVKLMEIVRTLITYVSGT